jgi:hypothetical protein
MNTQKHFLAIAVALVLGACGSSDDEQTTSPEPEPTPPTNTAPVANADETASINSQTIMIDVLGNDSDAEGDTLSISDITTVPSNGSAQISGTSIEYTANPNFVGIDSLEYSISDGELTSTASVSILSSQTMTLVGRVTDGPIPNAFVTVTVGDETFSAQADQNGDYILEIAFQDTHSPLTINAKGEGEQSQVELLSFMGASSELLALRNDDFQLTRDESADVNVTHVTSASYLLAKEQNGAVSFSDKSNFQGSLGEVSFQSILDTSGFLKLLIDNDSYMIPEGETSLSTLSRTNTDGSDADIETAINLYWANAGLLDDEGNLDPQAQADLQVAITETISDPDVGDDFEMADFSGKSLLFAPSVYNYALDRRFPSNATAFVFGDDNTGTYSQEKITSAFTSEQIDFAWTLAGGELNIDFESVPTESYPFYNYSRVLEEYGEDAAQAFSATYTEDGGAQLRVTYEYVSSTLKLMNKSDLGFNTAHTFDVLEQLFIPDSNGSEVAFARSSEFSNTGYFVVPTESSQVDIGSLDITGTWALPVYDLYVESGILGQADTFTQLFHDFITLNSDGTGVTQRGQNPLIWEATDKGFQYTQSNGVTIELELVLEDDGEFAILGQYGSQTIQSRHFTGTILRQDWDELTKDTLVADLPTAWFSTINAGLSEEGADNENGISLDQVFAFSVLSDGTMGRISYFDPRVEGENPYFFSDKNSFNWSVFEFGNFVAFEASRDFAVRGRAWKPVSSKKEGTIIYVIESDVYLSDFDRDGNYQTQLVIYPRLVAYKQGDLSIYEEVYAESLARGTLE